MKTDPSVQITRNRIREQRETIRRAFNRDFSGSKTAELLTEQTDAALKQVFGEIFKPAKTEPFIGATGSYGRRELCPASDIDLLVLVPGQSDPPLDQAVTQFVGKLWDVGLEVGHAVRTVEECVELAETDFEVKTSLLDSRYIAGSQEIGGRFSAALRARVFRKPVTGFVAGLIQATDDRHQKYGNSVRLLEPHVKESAGGLRDLHNLFWMLRAEHYGEWQSDSDQTPSTGMMLSFFSWLASRGIIAKDDVRQLDSALDQLLRVRHQLHYLTGRKTDRLEYPLLAPLADALLFKPDSGFTPVEQFMRNYYVNARTVFHYNIVLTDRMRYRVNRTHPDTGVRTENLANGFQITRFEGQTLLSYRGDPVKLFRSDPVELMQVFRLAQEHGAGLHDTLRIAISRCLHLITDDFRGSAKAAAVFREILSSKRRFFTAFRQMHNLEVLGRYIPEFGYIRAHYQHNVYHFYTTDEHTIAAVGHLEDLATDPDTAHNALAQLYREIPDLETLRLAVFLHDIGKSRGGNHCEIGVSLSRAILERIGLTGRADDVCFLVLNHLRMEQTAFRRNLKSPETIAQFASLVGTRRRLRMLYLLTYADMRAAAPNVWTDWKAALLLELFARADDQLASESGDETYDTRIAKRFLEEISADPYFAETQLESNLELHFEDFETWTEVTVITLDHPFRLSRICGVLTACDVNIFDAQVYTRPDGVIIDRFRVIDLVGETSIDTERKDKIRTTMRQVLIEGTDARDLVNRHMNKWRRRRRSASRVATEVQFDNSGSFTIIDIFAPDTPGLLFQITDRLAQLGLNVHAAKIGSRLDGAADCFYVLNDRRKKITDGNEKERIRETLLAELEG